MKKLSMSLLAGGFILAITSAFATKKPTSFTYFYNNGSCQTLITDTNCEGTGSDCTIQTSSGNTYTLKKTSCTGSTAKHQ